jgi:RNA polymerase sigma-70 factor (ECF subfamily)
LHRAFDRSAVALYRFILVRVRGDRDAADDLLQQTCCEAGRRSNRLPDNGEACEAWLRGIARNLIRRHWRNAKRAARMIPLGNGELARQLAADLESQPLPVDAMIRSEVTTQLLLAVTELSAAEQHLLFGFYFEQRPQADIARETGVSEKSVESRLYRARSRLREILRRMERSGEP